MNIVKTFAFIAALAASASASASPTSCPEHYAGGTAPTITNQRITVAARELCFSAFGVVHSGLTKTPLWSAEHLTRNRLSNAKGLERDNAFHAETRLPANERAELSDYSKSGFDRGHLAPSADMPNMDAQNESFSLANMIPQNPNNNRHLWAGIEGAVRNMAKQQGELFVITGALFHGQLKQIGGRVLVPSGIYKIIYDPKQGAAAYVVDNVDTDNFKVVSIEELERLSGIDFFPTMHPDVKKNPISLPAPNQKNGSYGMPKEPTQPSLNQTLKKFLR